MAGVALALTLGERSPTRMLFDQGGAKARNAGQGVLDLTSYLLAIVSTRHTGAAGAGVGTKNNTSIIAAARKA